MSRHRKIDRPVRIEVQVPASIASRVELELFSELEGRVPFGSRSALISRLLAEWLRDERGILL